MISLYPHASETDFDVLGAVEAEDRGHCNMGRGTNRPYVLSNMIASADGATAIDGLSEGLGGPADGELFAALRSLADAILVGSSTAREEDYRSPGRGSEQARSGREKRGQSPRPLLVVVTASLSVEPGQRLFTDPENRPLIATVSNAPAERRAELSSVAEIIDCGEERVELPSLIEELGSRGMATILAEGGPSLNGQLIAEDLIDEWNLTLSPILAAGGSPRPAHGEELAHPVAPMILSRVWQADELLFCRWVRSDRA